MKLSIVSPTFNCVERLRAHLASVVGQRLRPIEHILVDNLSTDGTEQVIAAYQKAAGYPVIHIREADRGLYEAMNKGVRRARGEWVQIFNSDNVYSNDRVLEEVFDHDLAGYDIISCGVQVGPEGTARTAPVHVKPEYDPARKIFHFPHQGMMVRREFYERHGLYDERFRIVSDSIFIFRHAPCARCLVLDISLALLPGDGISGRRSWRNTWETIQLLLFHHPSPRATRWREAVRQALQYVKYGLLKRQERVAEPGRKG